ncbi:MAG: Rha family transcriptional regulator [Rhodoferax sp.]|uniref:Rha family transcriptional regulator n=1 Tax=Rhodoferax sp. TaxID=50421 RepID=UPI003267C259
MITLEKHIPKSIQPLALVAVKEVPRVDTRLLAEALGNRHQSVFELVKDHQSDFAEFGKVRFETGASPSGQSERFALLIEDQAYLLLTYSRNTARTRALKVRLVKAFGEARRAAIQHGAEYLPSYRALHDEIDALAGGSDRARFVHMNVNKLINKTAGIEAGQRSTVPMPTQSLLCVAQTVAAKAMQGAPDYHAAYDRAKAAMLALSAITMLDTVEAQYG